ncbi:MAG: hypothetical protein AAGI07_05160 [Bacteroidota bacterium]
MKKVFLGGVGSESSWRAHVSRQLNINYVDPTVATTAEKELLADCDFLLYVITPCLRGFSLIPQLVDASNKNPEKTLYCALYEDAGKAFTAHQKKSLEAIGKMIEKNGGRWLKSLDEAIDFLNSYQ